MSQHIRGVLSLCGALRLGRVSGRIPRRGLLPLLGPRGLAWAARGSLSSMEPMNGPNLAFGSTRGSEEADFGIMADGSIDHSDICKQRSCIARDLSPSLLIGARRQTG